MKFVEIVDFDRVLVRSQALREARTRGRLPFITIPTKKGPGLLEILSNDDGLALYGVFVLLAASSADLEHRGRFVRHGRPMTSTEIARLSLIPPDRIDRDLNLLSRAGWIRFSEFASELYPEPSSEPASEFSSDGREDEDEDEDEDEGKTKGRDGDRPTPGDLAEAWNRARGPLPGVRLPVSSGRARHARARLVEVPDLGRWESAVAALSASSFCKGENGRKWIADFDFLLKPDTLAKIEEGKYDDRKAAAGPSRYSHLDGGDV